MKKAKRNFRWWTILALSGSMVMPFLFFERANLSSGINQQLNYQARLLDATGAVVPDGTYNMEFKIYQDGDGDLGGGDETLKWTETRISGDKVTVKNGYFSVQLGSVTAFASNVDWNQDTLWLSTNIGGTGTPSWDGEMTPFRRLAAAPYALNANQLGGLTASGFLQLAPGAAQTDSSTNNSIFVNKSNGTGNILQLQKSNSDVFSIANSGLATFSTDVDLTFGTTENLSVTSDLAGTVNVVSIVGTPSGTSGTTRGLLVQQANHGSNSNGLDSAIVVDNADTDLVLATAIEITNSGSLSTGITKGLDFNAVGIVTDIELQNGEQIDNNTDDTIVFTGTGGSNNEVLTVDLDSSSSSGPTLSGGGTFILINDNLSVGLDGVTTENINNSGYTFSGNDLYVDDMLGVNGNAYIDGTLILEGASTLNGLVTLTTDADFTLAGTENVAVTHDLAGTVNVLSIVGTPSGSAGTTNGAFIQQANHGSNTNGLDAALYIDNADSDLAIPAAISIQNSGGGGSPYTAIMDILGTALSATELTVLDGGLTESEVTGEIESVTAGNGLTGGGTADGVTLTVVSGNGGIVANADDITLDATVSGDSLSATTSSGSGLEILSTGLTLLQGCNDTQVLQWNESSDVWNCATPSAGGYATIQDEGTPLTQRTTINFSGSAVSCVDNSGSSRTDCTITGGNGSNLQDTYDSGSAGNQVITLDSTQDSIVITNPSSSGSDSAFTLQVNQNNTTAAVVVADLVQASNAANALNITANSIDTETGLAVTANALTSGKVLSVSSSATAFTGALAEINLSGSNAANTGSLLRLNNTGTASASTGLYIDHRATGSGNYALRIDDVASDNTPLIVDGDGRLGIGTTSITGSTERMLQVGSPTLRGNAAVYGELVAKGLKDLDTLTGIKDIFVYDTTADSDGGRWIDWATTDQLSWYTESLDDGPSDPCVLASDDRCYTQSFPRKAVLVVTNNALYIFDAINNVLWMKFSQNAAGWALGADTNNDPSSVTAVNGVIYVGTNGSSQGGLYVFDFVNDRMWNIDGTDRSGADVGISSRNGVVTYNSDNNTAFDLSVTGTAAEWEDINDVSATYITGSSTAVAIGAATNTSPGSGQTFVALATDSGLTVINMTAQKLLQYSESTADDYTSVALTKRGRMYGLNTTTDQVETWLNYDTDKASEVNGNDDQSYDESVGPALWTSIVNIQAGAPDALEVIERGSLSDDTSDILYVGHSLGLTEIHTNATGTNGWSKFYDTTRQTMLMPAAIDMALMMDDTSGTQAQDISFNNTDMAIFGSPTMAVQGVRGTAMNFDNSNDFLCSDSDQNNACDVDTSFNMSTTGWTFSLWFKHTTTAPAAGVDMLFEKCVTVTPAQATGCVAAYMSSTGAIVVANDDDATWTQGSSYDLTSTSSLTYNDNQWHQLIISRTNANDVDTYIDGNPLNLSSATGNTITLDGSQVVTIGASCSTTTGANCASANATNFWDGVIDDVVFTAGGTTVSQFSALQARRFYNDARPLLAKKVISVTDATTATTTTIGDSGETWIPNEFNGMFVTLTGGTGSGQTRRIISNTATVLTVSPAFQTTPDTTTDFEVDPEALYGSTNAVYAIGVTAENPLGQARQMCVGTNNGSDGGGVTCYNHQAGPNLIADLYHSDSEQTDDYGAEWTGTDYDDIRSIDMTARSLVIGSEAHLWAETEDVRLGQGLDYLAGQLFSIRAELINDGITATGSQALEVGFTGGADLAEYYTSPETLLPGEVVALEPNNVEGVQKSTEAYQKDVLGVVATAPGLLLGPSREQSYPIALVGRVPIKVTTENGPIKAGDRLTAAGTSGYAMRATHAGRVLGAALDDLTEDKYSDCPEGTNADVRCGTVTVFVNLVDYGGENVELVINEAEAAGALSSETILDPLSGLLSDNLVGEERDARTAQIAQADRILRYLSGRQSTSNSAVLADRVSAVDITGSNVYARSVVTLDFTAGGGLTVNGTATFNGDAFFNKSVAFAEETIFKRDVSLGGHLLTAGEQPEIQTDTAAGLQEASAGTALASSTINGNDTSGELTLTAGDQATAGKLLTVTFTKAFGKPPRIFLAPTNAAASQLKYFVNSTADGFSITTSDPPPVGLTFSFNYWIVE